MNVNPSGDQVYGGNYDRIVALSFRHSAQPRLIVVSEPSRGSADYKPRLRLILPLDTPLEAGAGIVFTDQPAIVRRDDYPSDPTFVIDSLDAPGGHNSPLVVSVVAGLTLTCEAGKGPEFTQPWRTVFLHKTGDSGWNLSGDLAPAA